jgi:hypothetical protein
MVLPFTAVRRGRSASVLASPCGRRCDRRGASPCPSVASSRAPQCCPRIASLYAPPNSPRSDRFHPDCNIPPPGKHCYTTRIHVELPAAPYYQNAPSPKYSLPIRLSSPIPDTPIRPNAPETLLPPLYSYLHATSNIFNRTKETKEIGKYMQTSRNTGMAGERTTKE